MATRRGRGTQAPQQSTPDVESSDSNSSITTIISTDSTSFENTEILAIKLNRNVDKISRFTSHKEYLEACIKDKLIPTNFKINLDPSIGNHNEEFLSTWYSKIEKFSLELMNDTVKFCSKTITESKATAKSIEDKIKIQAEPEEYNEIQTTINKYKEQKVKELHRIKTAKHRKLRWNLTTKQAQHQQTKRKETISIEEPQRLPHTTTIRQEEPIERSNTSNDNQVQAKPRTFAEILKPATNKRTTAPKAQPTQNTDIQILSRRNAAPRPQDQVPQPSRMQHRPTQSNNSSNQKNEVSPQPSNLEGGIQDLLATTMQAFELLQNNFKKLVDLKMTQKDA